MRTLHCLYVTALIRLVTLTFDRLTSKLVHIIARGVSNFPTNFGLSGTFSCRWTSCQTRHVSLRHWHLT